MTDIWRLLYPVSLRLASIQRYKGPQTGAAALSKQDRKRRRSQLLCRFLDAGMTNLPRPVAAGVQKAPRHEVAGNWALAVQRALWGFDGGAEFEDGCDADRLRPAHLHCGEIGRA